MFFGFLPFMPTYRVPWFETQGFTLTLAAAAILLSLTAISGGIRHRWENRNEPPPGLWTARVATVLGLLTLLFFGSAFALVSSAGEEILYGIPKSLTAALVLPHVTAVLLAALAVGLVIAWKRGLFPFRRRLHYTLFFLAAAGLHWIYWHWNILASATESPGKPRLPPPIELSNQGRPACSGYEQGHDRISLGELFHGMTLSVVVGLLALNCSGAPLLRRGRPPTGS
jgi:hypothetical protein